MTNKNTLSGPASLSPITDPAALSRTWRHLMGRLGFSDRTLWMLLIAADGVPVHGVQLGDAPRAFDHSTADNLMDVVRELDDKGLSVAFLFSRPGPGPHSADDLTWAEGLTGHLRRSKLRVWPVHLANDTELTMVEPDDLAVAR